MKTKTRDIMKSHGKRNYSQKTADAPPPQLPSRKKRTGLYIGVVLAVILVISVLLIGLLINRFNWLPATKPEQTNTILTIDVPTAMKGESVTIQAILEDENENLIQNVDVDFQIYEDGSWKEIGSAKTDSSGNASILHTPLTTGTFQIKAVFKGTTNYAQSNSMVATLSVEAWCQIGISYVASDGLTVTLNSFTITEKTGSYQYVIAYTLTNDKPDQAIIEGTFKMYYSNETGGLPQYGSFDKLFPGDTKSRTYSFEELKSKPFGVLEYHHDHFFKSMPLEDSLKWKIEIPQ